MSHRFELLRGFSSELQDDHLDEDQSEVEVQDGDSSRTYHQRTVTLRGKFHGTPVVIIHEAYHFFGGGPPTCSDVFDLFTADPEVRYEGTIRPISGWTKVRRWFGRGGLVGAHPVYRQYEFDFQIGPGKGSEPTAFEHELHAHLQRGCYELAFQAGAGINGIYAAQPYANVGQLEALLVQQIGLWNAISRA